MMVNTTNQIPTKRKKKFTGGNASKRHRDRVNIEFSNLAKLLPFPENVIAKLDKSSILRLAVSYIRAKSFFKDALPLNGDEQSVERSKLPSNDDLYKGILEETCITEFFLQALDGFLIVITEDLKVLYVSESVREYLGYCQAGIIHESFLQFIHWGDEDSIKDALRFDQHQNADSSHGAVENEKRKAKFASDEERQKLTEVNGSKTEPTISSRIQSRRFVCRMKCAFSCSSRFYTAFQSFQFSGHVRRSTIQEGKEQRTLNTLIAFGCPLNNTKIDPRDLLSDSFDDARPSYEDSDSNGATLKMIGLHIEPRLRPHIAPIPIAQNEADGKMSAQTPHNYPFSRRFGVGPHTEARFNGNYNHAARLYPSYHHIAHEYYREGLRFANGWNGRSSSLSNSPISDASSPRGIKRSASADASLDGSEVINGKKLTRYDAPPFIPSQNGFSGMPLDDIHSSARILMQLKSTQRRLSDNGHLRNESESDSSTSDDRSELYRNDDSYDCISKDQVFIDQPYPSVFPTKFHSSNGYASRTDYLSDAASYERSWEDRERNRQHSEQAEGHNDRCSDGYSHDRVAHRRLSPSKIHDDRIRSARTSSSPERISASRVYRSRYSPISGIENSSLKQSLPKKELNKGFHISTILGLSDDTSNGAGKANGNTQLVCERTSKHEGRHGGAGSPATASSLCKGSGLTGVHYAETDRKTIRRVSDSAAKMGHFVDFPDGSGRSFVGTRGDRDVITLNAEVSNMDDIKTSFAHLLQGFTATITRSIDRSIDTIFKP